MCPKGIQNRRYITLSVVFASYSCPSSDGPQSNDSATSCNDGSSNGSKFHFLQILIAVANPEQTNQRHTQAVSYQALSLL